MNDLNSVCETGRLVRDSELSFTPSGFPVGKLTIAVKRGVKKGEEWKDETSFFDVKASGKLFQTMHDRGSLRKGTQVNVQGYLKQDRWKDRETGENRSRIVIVADLVQPVKAPNDNTGKPQDVEAESEEFDETLPTDDELPF